jgi:HAD superfamily hydrolase (TIGR01549 family)
MSDRALNLEALVFDMDGTLIESSMVIPDAYIATVQEVGGTTCTRAEVIRAYSVGPPAAMLTHLLGRAATPGEVDRYHERLEEAAARASIYPGIEETLRELDGRVALAVFTGASLRACKLLLQATGLLPYFDTLVGADEVARPKPEPDGVHLACERLGVPISSAAYVGDAPNDLEAARRSGALAVAAAWGHLYYAREPADVVLDDPRGLLRLIGRSA